MKTAYKLPLINKLIYDNYNVDFTIKLMSAVDNKDRPFTVLIGEHGSNRIREIQQLVAMTNALSIRYHEQKNDLEFQTSVQAYSLSLNLLLKNELDLEKLIMQLSKSETYEGHDGKDHPVGIYLVLDKLGTLLRAGDSFVAALTTLVNMYPNELSVLNTDEVHHHIIIPLTDMEWRSALNIQPKLKSLTTVVKMPTFSPTKIKDAVRYELSLKNLTIEDDILEHLLNMSKRYLTDLVEPGSSIHLANQTLAGTGEITISTIDKTVKQLTEVDAEKLNLPHNELTKVLESKIVGQTPVLSSISKGIKRGQMNLSSRPRTIYNCLLYGESGIGKTLIAEQLALLITGQTKFLRIDCGELQSAETASARLLGMPVGYRGYETGGILTEFARKYRNGVVLLDEIEKANPEVQNLFMRVLDTGSVTSATGEEFNLQNYIFIATTNAGVKSNTIGFSSSVSNVDPAEELSDSFKPEFLNRFDDIMELKKLNKHDLAEISKRTIEDILKDVRNNGKILKLTTDKINQLSEEIAEQSSNGRQVYKNTYRKIQDDYLLN